MTDISGHGSEILSAGNYRLERFIMHSLVSGVNVDLKNLFKRIEIYEDIYSSHITAKLYMEDGLNFPERFPIVGQEKVEIAFKTDVTALPLVELVFRVYKLDGHAIAANGKSQEYVLHLISEGGYFNFSQYCGYALSGTVSDMVGSVFKKHFPEMVWKDRLSIEPTKDNYVLVLPGSFTAFRSITWLANRAIPKIGLDYSPFMFYETLDGYNFKSLSSIIEAGSSDPMTYLFTAANIGIVEGAKQELGFKSILPNRYHKIQRFEELGRFDAAENIVNGRIVSRMRVHDLVRKEDRYSRFQESDIFESMKKLGDVPRVRKGDSVLESLLQKGGAYFYLPSTPYTVWSQGNQIVDNSNVESLYLKRKYHMNAFLTQKMVIEVFGDSRRRVGDVVRIKIPKPQSDATSLQDRDDKNLSGEYLVTSIRHTLATSYSCKMELSRNGMGV